MRKRLLGDDDCIAVASAGEVNRSMSLPLAEMDAVWNSGTLTGQVTEQTASANRLVLPSEADPFGLKVCENNSPMFIRRCACGGKKVRM